MCFVFSGLAVAQSRACLRVRSICDSCEQTSVDKTTETVFHSSDKRVKQGGFGGDDTLLLFSRLQEANAGF